MIRLASVSDEKLWKKAEEVSKNLCWSRAKAFRTLKRQEAAKAIKGMK
jgi:hypothetical protein